MQCIILIPCLTREVGPMTSRGIFQPKSLYDSASDMSTMWVSLFTMLCINFFKMSPICWQNCARFCPYKRFLVIFITLKIYVNLIALQLDNAALRLVEVGGYFISFPWKFCQYWSIQSNSPSGLFEHSDSTQSSLFKNNSKSEIHTCA